MQVGEKWQTIHDKQETERPLNQNINIVFPCGDTQSSCLMPCDACDGKKVWTVVNSSTRTLGIVWFFCFASICCLPFALFPFFSDFFRVYKHYCSTCGNHIKTDKKNVTKKILCVLIVFPTIGFILLLYMLCKYIGLI